MNNDKLYYVYVTTNLINGKQYVGDHKINNNKSGYYIGSGDLIKKAIKKYKCNNFFKEILEWFDTREEAFLSQEKYITLFNTLQPNGYNISPKGGSQTNGGFSDETKLKLSLALLGHKHFAPGYKHSPETIEKCKQLWKLRPPRSEELKKKYGLNAKGKKHTVEQNRLKSIRQSRPILQYSLNNELLFEYPSIKEAALKLKISRSNISRALSNSNYTTAGYFWKYKN